ncbi:uncharacterized protein LOC124299178 [Neodiprion virginianus]|uniref:uncharacterized protein LOC124299178 n=2 Tax=Neodiprion TaxID=270857 RepID=UPI001EE74A6D|nr:uncharacterized protein LOC124299178 [Neodiprion virginianus]
MFKPLPNVIKTPECGNVQDSNYVIDWEEIARWALEHGDLEDTGDQCDPGENSARTIDWCLVAESFMRDEAADNVSDICDSDAINESVQAHDQHISFLDTQQEQRTESENFGRQADRGSSAGQSRGRLIRTPEQRRPRPQAVGNSSYIGNSVLNRSIRESDFNDTSGADWTPLSSIKDFSCMEADYMHDSTQDYESDIMSYLENRAERNRPNSMAEGYHLPGSTYGRAENSDDYKMYTSTPKRNQRTTRAEAFEMPDGSKMFNVTFEECLKFGRRLRHTSDVRDNEGCQIMQLDRKIDEKPNGTRHRIDIARRWLDMDDDNGNGFY